MHSISKKELVAKFSNSLGSDSLCIQDSRIPYTFSIKQSSIDLDVYLWNVFFNSSGKRSMNEYRMNFNIGKDRFVDWSSGRFPLYCGYCDEFGLFVLWDPSRHNPDIHIGNMQVKVDTLIQSLSNGISFQYRMTSRGIEKVIVCTPNNLSKAIEMRYDQYLDELISKRPSLFLNGNHLSTEYSRIYQYYLDHPDCSIFEVVRDLNIPLSKAAVYIHNLYLFQDCPREPFGPEEMRYIEQKISNQQSTHADSCPFYVQNELHLPKSLISDVELIIGLQKLDQYM